VSLNQRIGSGEESELGELFDDPAADDPVDAAEDALRRQAVQRALAKLPERERRIVELRFGFDTGEPETLEAIAKELGITRERVRQLEQETLARLEGELDLVRAA
jgi:RNA polymerase primary sigma factor